MRLKTFCRSKIAMHKAGKRSRMVIEIGSMLYCVRSILHIVFDNADNAYHDKISTTVCMSMGNVEISWKCRR